MLGLFVSCVAPPMLPPAPPTAVEAPRHRARDLSICPGVLPLGSNDAITDVPGVLVGHATWRDGLHTNTGVTVIRLGEPAAGQGPLPAAIRTQRGNGKVVGHRTLEERRMLAGPIVLTSARASASVAAAAQKWWQEQPQVAGRSPEVLVVGIDDSWLSDPRAPVLPDVLVASALTNASAGAVPVGNVGAGAGSMCCGWKGGIGTSSRRVGGHTVGVLVQASFGGSLQMELHGSHGPERRVIPLQPEFFGGDVGSKDLDRGCTIVVATDAPLDARELGQLAARAFEGMAGMGARSTAGSGDVAILFSTASASGPHLEDGTLVPLGQATADATEQAIIDALCAAATTTAMGHTVPALPLDRLEPLLSPFRGFRF